VPVAWQLRSSKYQQETAAPLGAEKFVAASLRIGLADLDIRKVFHRCDPV
jgi:hypothetical protein